MSEETEPTKPTKPQPRDDKGRWASSDDVNRALIEQIRAENKELREKLDATHSELTKITEREKQKEQALALESKRAELERLDPRLAKKHKEETDITKLDVIIDTAKSFQDNFAEYVDEKKEVPRIPLSRKDLLDMEKNTA